MLTAALLQPLTRLRGRGIAVRRLEDDVTGGQWLIALGVAVLLGLGLTAAISAWLLGA